MVLAPDRSAPVVGVAVVYDVGIRSEPQGRTGFAHLFEHLMFQGSESLEKLAHFRHVQGSGGTFNGSTHLDYTDYYEMLPSNALERALFLEADRMRGPRLTEENLRNQVDVVKEEIRVNVLNRPYGGFPWLKLPPVMFDTFPNAHDGYGSFDDLEAATVPDAEDFFARYYAAGNAVLAVAGDLDAELTAKLVERHFGDVPARPAPPRPDFAEPDLTGERREAYTDALAPLPAFAAAWRVPDPISDLGGYLPYVVLAEVLTDGDASRLVRRLVLTDRTRDHRRRLRRVHGRAVRRARPHRPARPGPPATGRRRRRGAGRGRRGDRPGRAGRPRARASWPARWPACRPTCCATRTRCSTGRCATGCWSSSAGDAPMADQPQPTC